MFWRQCIIIFGWCVVALPKTSSVENTSSKGQFGIDLGIVKTDNPDPVIAGGFLTYTLSVTNYGPYADEGVKVTDTLPAEVTFNYADPAPEGGTSPEYWWTIPYLDVGQTEIISINVTVN